MRRAIKRILWRMGWDIVQYNPATHPLARRAKLLENYRIDLVLDVGANTGQYARELRELGYEGRIVSFEPLPAAVAELRRAAAGDPKWEVRHHACGAENGKRNIRVAANSQSSSFLPMKPEHLRAFPESGYVGSEVVEIKRLDTIIEEVAGPEAQIWLKMDVQGFEAAVVEGSSGCLARIQAIQAEISLQAMYEGETTLNDFLPLMAQKGFLLVGLETYLSELSTSHLLQVECIFRRTKCP
jgi:FkbM family methyltransferase